jgi:hypothetical protein
LVEEVSVARIRVDDEAQWLSCRIPRHLIRFLKGRTSDRKLRLWACASARERFGENAARCSLIELAEKWADGEPLSPVTSDLRYGAWSASAYEAAYEGTVRTLEKYADSEAKDRSTNFQLATLHDIFGNPFRPVLVERSWLTPTVTSLAAAIYDDRQLPSGLFDDQRLGVLADALEDAGCTDQDILAHCRGGGEHVRGCWVVDLLLDKE